MGPPGRDGRDGLAGPAGQKGLDGKDGVDGRDGTNGRDGLGFDDLDVEFNDGRQFLVFRRGSETKRFRLSNTCYRGVYESGRLYEKGDQVTHSGSTWTAMADTQDMPGDGVTAWLLSSKRGRDGKPGPRGEKGEAGRDGRDLTQLGPDGSKW